jgi:hypothetical protein
METDPRRLLKFHYSELDQNPDLPVSLNFTQIFTGLVLNDDGQVYQPAQPERIYVSRYQIPEIELYPVFHKPISKFYAVSHDDH